MLLREEKVMRMSNKNPSSQKPKNAEVDQKRVIFVKKRSEPLPVIVVIQIIEGKTIISDGNGTKAEVESYTPDPRFLQEN